MSRRVTDLLFALLLGATLFGISLATPSIAGGDDAYRHVRFAHRLVTDTQAALADPWHLEYMWPKPVDIWFGYHVLLAPFTLVLPLILAAKLAGSLVWTASAYAIARLLDSLGVARRHAWTALAVAGSGIVLYRATLMRPFLLSLLLVILALRYTLEEKPWRVALVSCIHAASYSMFFLPAMPVGLYLIFKRTKPALALTLACAGGLALGLVLNPFFPENVWFAKAVVLTRFGADMARTLKVGGEVLPLNPWWLAVSIPALAVWLAGIAVMVRRWKTGQPKVAVLVLLAMSCACLAVSLRAARMFDYFIPSAVLFAAMVLAPYADLHPRRARAAGWTLAIVASVSLIPALMTEFSAPRVERYRGAAEFLAKQPSQTVVWNTQWQQYPFLYYWNPNSRYLTGMDPTLFYNADPERYWQWRKLADDNVQDASEAGLLLNSFQATHLVVDRTITPKLAEVLKGCTPEVFRDSEFSIFALR